MATRRQCNVITNFMNTYNDEEKKTIIGLVLKKKIKLNVEFIPMDDFDKVLKELTPREVIQQVAQGFSLGNPFFFKDPSGLYVSVDRNGIMMYIRRRAETFADEIIKINRDKMPPRLKADLERVEKIDKEIAEQRKQYKARERVINVPNVDSGEYDDYTEVRATTREPVTTASATTIPLHMTIA